MRIKNLFLLLAAVFCTVSLSAQTSSVSGKVLDPAGEPVAGAGVYGL